MPGALDHAHRRRRRWRRIEQARIDRRTLGTADQRMVRKNVERNRVLARDDAIDQRTGAARAEVDDLLLFELFEVAACPLLASGSAEIGDEQRRAGAARNPPRQLALPLRIEQ